MKTILVTGGCGFIGANFIRYLLARSEFQGTIVNADNLTYAGNPDNLADIERKYPHRYHFIRADICDMAAMEKIFRAFPVDTICHFAAESHVDRSILTPDAFVRTNIMGTFNLLELARRHHEQMVLFHHISTDEVYGSLNGTDRFVEETPYRPNSPYSASKAASDHLVRAYGKTYQLPVTISNCSNNYGPYQFPEKLIPLMILNALEGKPLPVYGTGANIRDWLYVTDHCKAVWLIMNRGKRGETYNIGGASEMNNLRVVEKVCDLVDEMAPPLKGRDRKGLITFVKDRPGHDLRYAIDFTKLKTQLGWTPDESFSTGLKKTIRWYLENPGWVERARSGEYASWMHRQYAL